MAIKPSSSLLYFSFHSGGDIDLNWETVARLGELSYRCNLCRRCAQTCPLALDNGLIAREIRKIFSQEMGYAPKPLPEQVLHLAQYSMVRFNTCMIPPLVSSDSIFSTPRRNFCTSSSSSSLNWSKYHRCISETKRSKRFEMVRSTRKRSCRSRNACTEIINWNGGMYCEKR